MNLLRSSRALALLALLSAPLAAHDFWIEPATFRPAPDAILAVRLRVGDFGRGDEVQRNGGRIVRFVAVGPEGEKEILGRDGANPAGYVRLGADGLYVLGYRSNHASVELEAAKFEGYLRERGLDSILEQRKQRSESALPGREIYSRCSKALVRIGEASAGFDRPLGFTLELVPETNPFALGGAKVSGDAAALAPFSLRLLYEGQPLAGALVGATRLDRAPELPPATAEDTLVARTNRDGSAILQLSSGGKWLFAAVHMIHAEGNADADWESFWASLTVEIP